jgi:hypothetical protein
MSCSGEKMKSEESIVASNGSLSQLHPTPHERPLMGVRLARAQHLHASTELLDPSTVISHARVIARHLFHFLWLSPRVVKPAVHMLIIAVITAPCADPQIVLELLVSDTSV